MRQGGGDGGVPPADDSSSHWPDIEPTHTDPAGLPVPDDDVDPIDIPVPDGSSDMDPDDESFWTAWMKEIRTDEFYLVEKFQKQIQRREQWRDGQSHPRARRGCSATSSSAGGDTPEIAQSSHHAVQGSSIHATDDDYDTWCAWEPQSFC